MYLLRENKGTDQLCSYYTADLHLRFHMQNTGFCHDPAQLIQCQLNCKNEKINDLTTDGFVTIYLQNDMSCFVRKPVSRVSDRV